MGGLTQEERELANHILSHQGAINKELNRINKEASQRLADIRILKEEPSESILYQPKVFLTAGCFIMSLQAGAHPILTLIFLACTIFIALSALREIKQSKTGCHLSCNLVRSEDFREVSDSIVAEAEDASYTFLEEYLEMNPDIMLVGKRVFCAACDEAPEGVEVRMLKFNGNRGKRLSRGLDVEQIEWCKICDTRI